METTTERPPKPRGKDIVWCPSHGWVDQTQHDHNDLTRHEAVTHNAWVLGNVPIEEWTQHLVPAPLLPRREQDDA